MIEMTLTELPCGPFSVELLAQQQFVLLPGSTAILSVMSESVRQLLAAASEKGPFLAVAAEPSGMTASEPSAERIVCLSRITSATPIHAQTGYVQLQGVIRARIIDVPTCDPQNRLQTVEPLRGGGFSSAVQQNRLRHQLHRALREMFPQLGRKDLISLWTYEELSVGRLCDALADLLPCDWESKRQLLQTANVEQRCELLLSLLDSTAYRSAVFPPFSLN